MRAAACYHSGPARTDRLAAHGRAAVPQCRITSGRRTSELQYHSVKYLFVHQNFPGQFLHVVRHLTSQQRHDLVFITEPNRNQISGVRKVPYRRPGGPATQTHPVARDLDAAAHRADVVARTARNLNQLGYTPDIIIGHHGWGELLNLADVWPGVPILGYMEFYYQTGAADVGFDPEFLA